MEETLDLFSYFLAENSFGDKNDWDKSTHCTK